MLSPIGGEQLSQATHKILLANSITVNIGDPLALVYSSNKTTATNAAASVGGVGVHILGVVTGFTDVNGSPLPDGYSTTNSNQSSVATGTAANVYATYVEPSDDQMFLADLTAVAGTTAGSDQVGVYFNLSSSTVAEVDESTVGVTLATQDQVLSYGVNPSNSKQIICKIVCTQSRGKLA